MKRIWSLLLVCLLLCGCGAGEGETSPESTFGTAISTDPSADSPAPQTQGAVLAFTPDVSQVYGIRSFAGGVLLFSGTERTRLTLLNQDTLQVITDTELADFLSHEDPSLRIRDRELSYYRESAGQTVVLDSALKEIRRIAAPAGLVGSPILSDDRSTLFYCTETAVKAWDLETDIRRTLKEMAYTSQTLAGVHLQDTVLQCRIEDGTHTRTLFLDTENGQQLAALDGLIPMVSQDDRYFACLPSGFSQTPVFGKGTEAPWTLIPEDPGAAFVFLENSSRAVTLSTPSDGNIRLEVYDLITGRRTAALSMKDSQEPLSIIQTGDWIWILAGAPAHPILYRWNPGRTPLQDPQVYLHRHYTAQSPDLEGLEASREYAQEIGDRYGIRVLIWKDASAAQPWDYDFEAEYLVPVLQEELQLLDQRLAQYGKDVLEQTASHFTSLTIGLVRSIRGSAESGSLDTATGVQYLDGTDAYVMIAVGEFSERTLYHELFHVMETHIWGNSIAFDQWDSLNPAGFQYDYDYASNAARDSGIYLHRESRAFIDTYSMSYPKEDRARILEYAMLPGNRELFQSPILQRKLRAVCDGIREAYHLKETPESSFLWEQYLD